MMKTRVLVIDVKKAVLRAHAVCKQRPQSKECTIAWEEVEELTSVLADQHREFLWGTTTVDAPEVPPSHPGWKEVSAD